ncbi:MAG: polyprenyl synthetase family protein [Ignavibacteria bacterium]|nr:MAG: polyprenyl synthetase family protein [Ignavibacteria bacterium]
MTDFLQLYGRYRDIIDRHLAEVIDRDEPVTMYEPARYVLSGGGKRIRPVLVMLSCQAVGGDPMDAVDAGVAVEILHNFTLVHDDIMDRADTRRGRQTVHKKWDENIAILVGDELMGIAYKKLLNTEKGDVRKLTRVFTEGVIEVCEGQSYDKEFEALPSVTEEQYLMMIAKKTGWLVAISAEMGAIIGGADEVKSAALLEYARCIGRAFQIQDDLLDVVAEEDKLGKPIGGDIIEGKKTFLLTSALNRAEGEALELLQSVATHTAEEHDLVARVTRAYEQLGILDLARTRIEQDTHDALEALERLDDNEGRRMLQWFARMLLERKH